jgi:hypothetical protein
MTGITMEVFPMSIAAWVVLTFILNVARQALSLNLRILRNTSVSELRVCLLRMYIGGDGLRGLFAEVELAVGVEVVVAVDPNRSTPVCLFIAFFITRSLAIGSFFLDDKLLAAICINGVYLLKLTRWLRTRLLKLRRVHLLHCLLLLFILLKTLLRLVRG